MSKIDLAVYNLFKTDTNLISLVNGNINPIKPKEEDKTPMVLFLITDEVPGYSKNGKTPSKCNIHVTIYSTSYENLMTISDIVETNMEKWKGDCNEVYIHTSRIMNKDREFHFPSGVYAFTIITQLQFSENDS